jgi:HlyD family secretion protein
MKKVIWLLVLLMLAVAGWWLGRDEEIVVQAVQVARGEVQDTVTNTRAGSVMSCRRSKLSVPVGGQIARVLVTEGDRVEPGQLLITLYNLDIQAQFEQAQASEQALTIQHRRQCLLSESDRREANRFQALTNKGLASAEQLDLAEARANASEMACLAAMADVQQAQARVRLQQALLDKSRLQAPFAGVVAEVNAEVGEFATPSPPGIPTLPMVDLIDDSCYYVSAPIDEVDAGRLQPGLPVRISLDAFRDQPIDGNIRRIAPYVYAMEKQARTVEIEAQIHTDAMHPLLVGYSADVEVIVQSRENVLQIPTEAIFDHDKVYVLEQGRLQLRQVSTGLSNWQVTEIVSGVSEGEWVVVSAAVPLSDGVAARQ